MCTEDIYASNEHLRETSAEYNQTFQEGTMNLCDSKSGDTGPIGLRAATALHTDDRHFVVLVV